MEELLALEMSHDHRKWCFPLGGAWIVSGLPLIDTDDQLQARRVKGPEEVTSLPDHHWFPPQKESTF